MSEEMKAIIALINQLGLELRCTGKGVVNEVVGDKHFTRTSSSDYQYTVAAKS